MSDCALGEVRSRWEATVMSKGYAEHPCAPMTNVLFAFLHAYLGDDGLKGWLYLAQLQLAQMQC